MSNVCDFITDLPFFKNILELNKEQEKMFPVRFIPFLIGFEFVHVL